MDWTMHFSGVLLGFIILVPLGWKWDIDKKVSVLAAVIIGFTSAFSASGIHYYYELGVFEKVVIQAITIVIVAGALIAWRFFRDPDRVAPDLENAIISPADGKILYVKRTKDGQVPFSEKKGKKYLLNQYTQSDVLPLTGVLIGIAMNFLDVHINRAPINGKVVVCQRIPGIYVSLKKVEAILENERRLTVFENEGFRVGVVQIASRLVRKIVSYVREGEDVQKGQRIGMIRFGSQVDVFIPDSREVRVEVAIGQKVEAGVTVLAKMES